MTEPAGTDCTTGLRENGKAGSAVARLCGQPASRRVILSCGCGHSSGEQPTCQYHLDRVTYGTYYCGQCWEDGHWCPAWTPGSPWGT